MNEKAQLRLELLAARESLDPAALAAASSAVCRRLGAWPIFQNASVVMAYLAFRNELSLQALIDTHPEKIWALPRIDQDGRLAVHRYQAGQLVPHRWGVPEPSLNAPLVPLQEIDLVLVPGVGFDRQGGRLGYGGGYYDRLLCQFDAARVGIIHPSTLVDAIPCSEHDCQMDWIATPAGVFQTVTSP